MMHDMLNAKTMQFFIIIIFFLSKDLQKQLCKHNNLITILQNLKHYKIIPFLTTKPRDKLMKFKTLQDNSFSNNKVKG